MSTPGRITVIGIGNDFRHDDAVGLEVARRVRQAGLAEVTVIDGVSDDYALLSAWQQCDQAWLVDCTLSDSEAGTISRFDGLTEKIPAEIFTAYSTHTINIIKTIELSRTLDKLPRQLTLIGIEGADTSAGCGLTPVVEAAAVEVAALIVGSCKSACAAPEWRK